MSACSGAPIGDYGAYRLTAADRGRVQFRTLDAVNALRSARGTDPMALEASLTAAAATHSRDMAAQNRPWHFGSDGSSPPQRAARAGYRGAFRGEAISESFETEIETLAAWMEAPGSRSVILDPAAREMGLAWYQERNGKLWWTLVTGTPESAPTVPIASPSGLPPETVSPYASEPVDLPAAGSSLGIEPADAFPPTPLDGAARPTDLPPIAPPGSAPPGLRG